MAGYKSPDFNERTASARAAKQAALDKLRAKPALDPAIVAERQVAREAKEAAAAEKRAARQQAIEDEKTAKAEAKAEAERVAALGGLKKALPSAAELKAARDARYAARKARKG